MDPTEKDNINKNWGALLETTKLSKTFLAVFEEKDILANADLDLINAKKYEGQQAKVKAFYDIILTRPGAFNVLKYALKKTKQNGALQVLTQEQAHSPCKRKRHQTFLGVPDHIKTFLDGSKNLMILCTTDCSLSTQRLQENTSSTIYDDVKTFLGDVPKLLAMDRSKKAIFIINSGSETHRVLQAAKRLPHKTIMVTSNNIDGAIQDHFTWNDLSPIQQDNIRDKLNSLFPNTKITDQTLEKLEHETLVDFLNNKPIQLFTDNIPSELPYYVSRRFVTRYVLTDDLFRTNGKPDIFVFVDIEKWKLADYCVDNSTSTSRTFLEESTPTYRYVLLENDDDFDKIAKKVNVPVHLIRYENNNFRWLRSERSVGVVQNMVAAQHQQEILREEEFFEFIGTDGILRQPICISDTPGMGKSVLLGNMGKLLIKSTDHVVCFIIIGELIKSLKEQVGISENIQTSLKKYLVDTVCNNIIAKLVLEAKIRSKTMEIDLLLDGFDEIDSNDFALACRFLKTILGSYSSIRLWVTTRPHLLEMLENTLCVLGHNIQELNFDDQLHFLTEYWSQEEKFNHEKLESFAKQCLSCLNYNMNSDDKIIAGIPLQCLLIAEVYKDKVKPYCSSTDSGEQSIKLIGSIVLLYQLFIETKIRKFRSNYNKRAVSESDIFKSHIYFSFFVIFPDKDISKAGDNLNTESIDMEQLLDVGILELRGTQKLPHFIHRTFAEYFIALHFSNLIKNPPAQSPEKYLFHIIFHTKSCSVKVNQITVSGREFRYAVICYFVEKLLGGALSKINMEQLTKVILKQVVTASVYHNLPNLFEYFKSIFWTKQAINSFVFSDKLVLLCYNKSTLPLIQAVSDCYEASGASQINVLFINIVKSHVTPMHVAVKRGSFEIVNYLMVNKMLTLNTRQHSDILHTCVMNSLNQAQSIISDKIQILRRVLSLYETTIAWNTNTNELPIFAKSVNVELLIALLKIKFYKQFYTADILAELLRQKIKPLASSSYEQLLKFVYNFFSQDHKSLYTIFISPFRTNNNNSLLYAILCHSEPTMGTLDLFEKVYSGIPMDLRQDYINSESLILLTEVLANGRKAKYLDWLIKIGCSLENWREYDTPLTYAVVYDNLEAVNYILKHNHKFINMVNKSGKTALHTIGELRKSEKQLEILRTLLNSGADVLAKDNNDKNLLQCMITLQHGFEGSRFYQVLEILLPFYPKSHVNWFRSELLKQESFINANLIKLCTTIIG